MQIRLMQKSDYEAVYSLWLSCPGVALNTVRAALGDSVSISVAPRSETGRRWEV